MATMTAGRATRASAAAAAGSAVPTPAVNSINTNKAGPSGRQASASSSPESVEESIEVDQLDDDAPGRALALSSGSAQGARSGAGDHLAVAHRLSPAAAAIASASIDKGPNKSTARSVPAFLTKLYTMVNDSASDHLIHWSDAGDSFIVASSEKFGKEMLPRFFKHSNFGSFVRQLNMYGFHKVPHLNQGTLKGEVPETEMLEFASPHFQRGQPDLLCLIQRKKSGPESSNMFQPPASGPSPGGAPNRTGPPGPNTNTNSTDWNRVLSDLASIRKHQTVISADLKDLQTSNTHLWQEALASRDRHKRSQETINKILGFLAQVFGGKALEDGTDGGGIFEHDDDDRGMAFEAGTPNEPEKGKGRGSPMSRPRLPRLLLEDVPRDEGGGPSERRSASVASNTRARSKPKGSTRMEEVPDEVESRFSEQPSVDDQTRFSTVADSPPAPPSIPLRQMSSSTSSSTRPPPRPSTKATSSQSVVPASTSADASASSSSMAPLDERLLAALLSGANGPRTPQPYSFSWPSSSASTSAPFDLASGAASFPALPPPITSPTRLPAPTTTDNAPSPTDSALTPYRRMTKDTTAISHDVESLQAAIDQLVRNLPPEVQAQVAEAAANVNGSANVQAPPMEWNPSSGANSAGADFFDTDAFLHDFDAGNGAVWPPTSGVDIQGAYPSSSGTATNSVAQQGGGGDQALTPISSFLANYGRPGADGAVPPPASQAADGMDDFDRLWEDSSAADIGGDGHVNGSASNKRSASSDELLEQGKGKRVKT